MSALDPAEVRRIWRSLSEWPIGQERPLPAMTERMARLVAISTMDEPPGLDALLAEFPDLHPSELEAAGVILERHGERTAADAADLKALMAALMPFVRSRAEPLADAYARWSAAHPEPSP